MGAPKGNCNAAKNKAKCRLSKGTRKYGTSKMPLHERISHRGYAEQLTKKGLRTKNFTGNLKTIGRRFAKRMAF